jgi:hypothetical protein
MTSYTKTEKNRVKRNPKRGFYDRETIFKILSRNFLCHVSFIWEGQPIIIPTFYGLHNEEILFHGALSNRMLKHLMSGVPVCVSVTQLDSLVLARSAFHHSANYQSVVLFGQAREVPGNKKIEALKLISDQILSGRWEECRLPSKKEVEITTIVAFKADSGSAKIRTGPPSDETEDYQLPHWAGLLPLASGFSSPVADPELRPEIDLPASVKIALDESREKSS